MSEDKYRIIGRVISSSTRQGVAGARVEAWDKDSHVDDLVGNAVTDAEGFFVIEFDSSYFRELFADRRPDLFFKVFLQDKLIKSTEDSVLWNVDKHDIPVSIELDVDVRPKSIDEAPKDGPRVLRVTNDFDANEQLKIRAVDNPLPNSSLGIAGKSVQVSGPEEFHLTPLLIPFDVADITGIDLSTVRVFRLDEANKKFKPVWNSGVNRALGFFWANICRPGTYVAIGAPRDILLREALRQFSLAREEFDGCGNEKRQELMHRTFSVFLDAPVEAVDELREFLTRVEIQTGPGLETLGPHELRLGKGGHPLPFPLPQDADLRTFRERLSALDIAADGLPEEELLRPRELHHDVPPWDVAGPFTSWNGVEDFHVEKLRIWEIVSDIRFIDKVFPWLRSKNWWMHQHDVRHTGVASGGSNINASSVGNMYRQSAVPVDGPVITKPAIVDGKIYIGSGKTGGGPGGTLYRIDLATGTVENSFATSGTAYYGWKGIGGSPTVLSNRVYFSTVYGKIYCIDATTFTQIWMTDLKTANQSQNQPINNLDGDSWSGPLVVGNRVYVSGGEGESPNPFGFVFCLDATTGHVIWIFCTNKFVDPDNAGSENQPNVIPASAAVSNPLPAWATAAGFSLRTGPSDPPHKGASPWSSCAYDSVFNRVYVCTGNSRPDNPLPDEKYASGLLSLDATTGQFRGFFQPAQSDSYWPGDFDVDVPCSPTVYTRTGGQRVVCFGSKNGSFFILDADTLAVVARRQLLPKQNGSGLPGDVGTPIGSVVDLPVIGGVRTGENMYGVMATPAVSGSLERIFVGLGGYNGIGDSSKTPFMRALDWNNLHDAWSTTLGADGVTRYNTTNPPMYLTNEAGLSAPGLVNDVVFVSTSKTALYALSADTGVCLWSASTSSLGGSYSLGPAIYGDYVVLGAGSTVYIYKLRRRFWIPPDLVVIEKWPRWPWPDPGPLREVLGEILNRVR